MIQKTQYNEIDLLQLMLIVWRKRWVVLLCTVITSIIGIFYYFSSSNVYSSQVAIQVGIEKKNVLSLDDFYGFGAKTSEYYGTQIELIKSRRLLEGVVDALALDEHILSNRPVSSVEQWARERYQFYISEYFTYIEEYVPFVVPYLRNSDELLPPATKVQITKQLQEMVSASNKSNSQFIIVTAKAYSPELATKIVNAIADTYIAYHFNARKNENIGASDWLVNQLATIKLDIEAAEKDLQAFSDREDLVDIQGVMSLKANELKELSRQQTELEQIVDEHRSQYQSMIDRKDPASLLDTITITPLSILDKTLTALIDAKAKLLESSLRYGPKHPNYIFAKENVDNAQVELNEQVLGFVKVKEAELLTEEKKLEKLKALFNEAKTEFQQLTKLESELRQKKRQVDVHQELYDTMIKRLQETEVVGGLEQEFATVFDYALVDDSRNTSKRSVLLVLSAIPGFILGVLVSLLLGVITQRIWNVEELRRSTNIPVLASLPKIQRKYKKSRKKLYYQFTKDRVYLEAIHTLRTRLLANYKTARIISITSAMPEEGKSTIALHLSKACSDLEKVLIIDADLRRPSVTKMLGLSDNHPGLSDVLARRVKLSECIIRNREQGFDILSAGQSLQNSNSLLSSPVMPKLLNGLTKYYDRIIIETAPIHLFSDAEAVSKLVDGVLFVVKAEDTLKKDIKTGIDTLERIGANLLGSILNQSRVTTESYHYRRYIHEEESREKRSSRTKNVTPQIPFTKTSY